jgi:hypothetical protein
MKTVKGNAIANFIIGISGREENARDTKIRMGA